MSGKHQLIALWCYFSWFHLWTVFPVTWLLRLFFPSSVPSVDKYSLIPKITWNGTVDISTKFMGKRKCRDVFWNFCCFVCKTLCRPGCSLMKVLRVASLTELWVAGCRNLKHVDAVLLFLCSSSSLFLAAPGACAGRAGLHSAWAVGWSRKQRVWGTSPLWSLGSEWMCPPSCH